MVARSLVLRHLRSLPRPLVVSNARRALATPTPPPTAPEEPPLGPTTPYKHTKPPPPPQSWLTRAVKASPVAKRLFLALTGALGYGSTKQVSARRAYAMYEKLCASRPDEERAFWQDECHLPPTFQSWFTVTNLHVWLLTVRLRALPEPHGKVHIQALIDHFFLDVEERVRAVLQPASPSHPSPSSSSTATTSSASLTPEAKANADSSSDSTKAGEAQIQTPEQKFYTVANTPPAGAKRARGRAPERLVTRQMKILKEQWAGLGMAFDLALVKGDEEMAAAVWRNFLGARGARGIAYPPPSAPSSSQVAEEEAARKFFRRSVNLVGGEVEKVEKVDERGLEAEEARDDGSGVHDFPPEEAERYVKYPEVMLELVRYVRRELVRLERVPDAVILGQTRGRKGGVGIGGEFEGVERMRFGSVRGD